MSTVKPTKTIRAGVVTGMVYVPTPDSEAAAFIKNVTVKREIEDGKDIIVRAESPWLARVNDDMSDEERTDAIEASIDRAFDLLDLIREHDGGDVKSAGSSESGLMDRYRFTLHFDEKNAVTVRLPQPNPDTGEIRDEYSQSWTAQESEDVIRIGDLSEDTDDDGNKVETTKLFLLTSIGQWSVTASLSEEELSNAREQAKRRLRGGKDTSSETVEAPSAPEQSDPSNPLDL